MALANLTNRYFLNEYDFYTRYGFVVLKGSSNGFEKITKPKQSLSYNWQDENGIEYDLSNPVFETKMATIRGHILASGETDYNTKYNNLVADIKSPGSKIIKIVELGREYEVKYSDSGEPVRKTGIKGVAEIVVYLEIIFEILNENQVGGGIGNYYYGPVINFPVTWDNVLALPIIQAEERGNVVDLNTGSSRNKFSIAMRSVRGISSVIDLDSSNQVITEDYELLRTINNPQGVAYKIFGQGQTLNYSVNHVHKIVIS